VLKKFHSKQLHGMMNGIKYLGCEFSKALLRWYGVARGQVLLQMTITFQLFRSNMQFFMACLLDKFYF
jgi:hypothetical protein